MSAELIGCHGRSSAPFRACIPVGVETSTVSRVRQATTIPTTQMRPEGRSSHGCSTARSAGSRSALTDLAGEQYRTVLSALDRLVHDLVQPATRYWQAPTEPIVRLGVAGTSEVGLP